MPNDTRTPRGARQQGLSWPELTGVRPRAGSRGIGLEVACWLAEMGFTVLAMVPVNETATGDKIPMEKWAALAFRSPEEIRKSPVFKRRCGVAILTGKSGLVVIDLDGPEGEQAWRAVCAGCKIPQTMVIRTKHGRHLIFRSSGTAYKTQAGEIAPGIDVRGRGGVELVYDPGQPERHPTRICEPRELPEWLAHKVPKAGDPAPGGRTALDVAKLITDGIPPGRHDDTMTRLAMKICASELADRDSWHLLAQGILARSAEGTDAAGRPRDWFSQERIMGWWDSAARKLAQGGSSSDSDRLVFLSAADVQEEPVEWAWEGRLPLGVLALSAGAGGSAKSVHACWLAAGITRGTIPGDWKGIPQRVIWATIEASHAKEVKPRLMAAGADLSLIDFVVVKSGDGERASDHIRIFDPAWLADMRRKVREDNVGLIVLDPALDVIDRINTRDQQEVRAAIGRINAFAEEMGILILGIAHFNKMTTVDSAIDRITGSAAFSQRIRAAIAFAYDEESNCYVISQVKNNWGETHTLPNLSFGLDVVNVGARKLGITAVRLHWEDESVFSVDDLLGKRNTTARSPVQDKADTWLETKLASGPVPKAEIERETKLAGVSPAALKRAFRNLGVISESSPVDVGLGPRVGRRPAVWRLPEERIRLGGTPLY